LLSSPGRMPADTVGVAFWAVNTEQDEPIEPPAD
jgi:hypothetical protein